MSKFSISSIFSYNPQMYGIAARKIDQIVREELDALGEIYVRSLQQEMPVDTGLLKRSFGYIVATYGVGNWALIVGTKVPYASAAAQTGRRPLQKAPPLQKMMGWVSRKGLSDAQLYGKNPTAYSLRKNFLGGGRNPKRPFRLTVRSKANAKKKVAFLVMRYIATFGIRPLRLAWKVEEESQPRQLEAMANIEARLYEEL